MPWDAPVFFAVDSGRERVYLSAYSDRSRCPKSSDGTWCRSAQVLAGVFLGRYSRPAESGRGMYGGSWHPWEFADREWPDKCAACGGPAEHRSVWTDDVMVRADGGPGEFSKRTPPVGMMWDAFWLPDRYTKVDEGPGWVNVGPDGLALCVAVPYQSKDGSWRTMEWMPEQRASNCTLKQDGEHHCWVRSGDARKNQCHVDKNGRTCAAGAGSIVMPGWHSFVHGNLVKGCPDQLKQYGA